MRQVQARGGRSSLLPVTGLKNELGKGCLLAPVEWTPVRRDVELNSAVCATPCSVSVSAVRVARAAVSVKSTRRGALRCLVRAPARCPGHRWRTAHPRLSCLRRPAAHGSLQGAQWKCVGSSTSAVAKLDFCNVRCSSCAEAPPCTEGCGTSSTRQQSLPEQRCKQPDYREPEPVFRARPSHRESERHLTFEESKALTRSAGEGRQQDGCRASE